MAKKLGAAITMNAEALDQPESVTRFIAQVKESRPDGLLLIPFKKGHWEHVLRIINETGIPSVIMATLGVLLVDHIRQLHRKPGVYMISALDDFDAIEHGVKMVRTACWMRDARIVNINGTAYRTAQVAGLGTEVRTIPHQRFVEEFARTRPQGEVLTLAKAYRQNARQIVEPSEADIVEAAKCYFALKRVLEAEKGDALMMECLSGLRIPHKHVPPCMGFMSLRDQGIVAGCQSDLSATLTMMLVQSLFDRPGFQQNAAMDTEQNLYFGSHCTAPTKMKGLDAPPEPYVLRNHAEAGWGCVPRVLFTPGQEVTLAQYLLDRGPKMYVYSGKVVRCPDIPPAGGCRSNVEMTINEVADVCDVKGMHQIIFYGNHARPLRAFCQLYGIPVVT
jgi:L-fucose isomerase-like protein